MIQGKIGRIEDRDDQHGAKIVEDCQCRQEDSSDIGTREPSSDRTPRANAMSVAAGIAQPARVSGVSRLKAIYISAGTIMPPAAAAPGRMRRDQVES